MSAAAEDESLVHASCVSVPRADDGPSGVLILGPSGAGKSDLALRLMARGARLVADDRTRLRRDGDRIRASAPDRLAGLIEARGVGLLRVAATAPVADLALAVSLTPAGDDAEKMARDKRARADSPVEKPAERLPEPRFAEFLGLRIPLVPGTCCDRMAAIALVLAQGGALLDPDATPVAG